MSRSAELAAWIESCSTAKELSSQIELLAPELKNELLTEALQHYEIAEEYERGEVSFSKNFRTHTALRAYCRLPDIRNSVHLDLPGWNSGNTPSVNVIDTSALFGVFSSGRAAKRRMLNRETIFARSNARICYTGEELFQSDWDVLHMLLCMSDGTFNKRICVRPIDVMKRLQMPPSGFNYDLLMTTMVRLRHAALDIEVFDQDGKKRFAVGRPDVKGGWSKKAVITSVNLIKDLIWIRGNDIYFELDSRLMRLIGNNEYGLIDWETRLNINKNELAKKLQCLFSGQKQNRQFHNIEKLRQLCGLESPMKTFIMLLTKALNELMRVGAIQAYWISRMERGHPEKRVLAIWKTSFPSESEPVPDFEGRPGKLVCGQVQIEDGTPV